MAGRILKISLLGKPYSGKTTAVNKLFELGVLEAVPKNASLQLLDATLWVQPARFSDWWLRKEPRWKRFYDHVLLLSWYSGPTLSATLVEEFLLRDCQGILFFVDTLPGSLQANEKALRRLSLQFPKFHAGPLEGFPLVFCHNRIDECGEKLPSSDQQALDFEIPVPQGETFTLRAATEVEKRYLEKLNRRLNRYRAPHFFTSAKLGYSISEAFLSLLERMVP